MNTSPTELDSKLNWSSDAPYGISDFEPGVADKYQDGSFVREDQIKCCVAGCEQWLQRRRVGQTKADALFCPDHGISVSAAPTYIYKDYKRNFIIGRELLDSVTKVESWRLGNE